jgi:hypothetical protein
MTDEAASSQIEPWLREILRCPACHSELADAQGPTGPPTSTSWTG